MDKKVKEYLKKQPPEQQNIIKELRNLLFTTIPNCDEKMAWGVLAYRGGKFYLAGMKERVHMGFAICELLKDEMANFEGSGKTMRHLKITSLEDINKNKIVRLIKLVDQKAKCPKH